MSFFDKIVGGTRGYFDQKKEDRESLEKMQKEIDFQRRQVFEEEYKKNALEVARANAKKDAMQLSGLQKLRALNRARNLDRQDTAPPITFFEKLSEHTRKNIARREENLAKTKMMREAGKGERVSKLAEQRMSREQRLSNRPKPFGNR